MNAIKFQDTKLIYKTSAAFLYAKNKSPRTTTRDAWAPQLLSPCTATREAQATQRRSDTARRGEKKGA